MSRTRTLSRTETSLLSVKIDTIRRDYSRRGTGARKQTSQGTAIYSAGPLFPNLPTGPAEQRPAMVPLFCSRGYSAQGNGSTDILRRAMTPHGIGRR